MKIKVINNIAHIKLPKYKINDYFKVNSGLFLDNSYDDITDYTDEIEKERILEYKEDGYIIRDGCCDSKVAYLKFKEGQVIFSYNRMFSYYLNTNTGKYKVGWDEYHSDLIHMVFNGNSYKGNGLFAERVKFYNGRWREYDIDFIIELLDKYTNFTNTSTENYLVNSYYSYDKEIEEWSEEFNQKCKVK